MLTAKLQTLARWTQSKIAYWIYIDLQNNCRIILRRCFCILDVYVCTQHAAPCATAVELTAFAARFVELISGLGVETLTLIGRWDVASDWCCSWLRQSRPNPCRCSNLAQPNRRDQPGASLSVLASEIPAWIVSSLENREYGRRLKDSHSCQHRESCVWDGVGM